MLPMSPSCRCHSVVDATELSTSRSCQCHSVVDVTHLSMSQLSTSHSSRCHAAVNVLELSYRCVPDYYGLGFSRLQPRGLHEKCVRQLVPSLTQLVPSLILMGPHGLQYSSPRDWGVFTRGQRELYGLDLTLAPAID